MRRYVLLLALFAFVSSPIIAQAGDDDDPELEVGDGDGAGGAEDDAEEQKRKNRGQGLGGNQGSRDDIGAPALARVTQKNVNAAIAAGVKWLKKRQDKSGSWGPVRANRRYGEKKKSGDYVRDELAPTAFSVYTLSKCDVKRSSPAIKRGLKWIERETEFVFDVQGGKAGNANSKPQKVSKSSPRLLTTYESAAIVLMIEAVFQRSEKLTGKHKKRKWKTDNPLKRPRKSRIPEQAWLQMHNRILALTKGRVLTSGGGGRGRGGGGKSSRTTIPGAQVRGGKNGGGWRYGPGKDADLSATQFVLLALRAASQSGYPVEKTAPDVWKHAAVYVKNCQRSDGGFAYQIGQPKVTGSMTACGIASLIICKEQMLLAKQEPSADIDERIKKGLAWLNEHYQASRNPNGTHNYYYMYGVERVGDLTGRKEFGGRDWYVRGAAYLLQSQHKGGEWMDQTAFPPRDVLGTCYALLFLKRATPPTVTLGTGDRK